MKHFPILEPHEITHFIIHAVFKLSEEAQNCRDAGHEHLHKLYQRRYEILKSALDKILIEEGG